MVFQIFYLESTRTKIDLTEGKFKLLENYCVFALKLSKYIYYFIVRRMNKN